MSPEYLKGIRRILTVSADTELVSAPAYLRAAQHAPALNNFGSAISIIQDELAHAHIGYRLLGDLGVDMNRLIYEREPAAFKYPYAFDVPLDSWAELVLANALYDQAGFVLLSDVHRVEHVRAVEARARQGRQGGDLPPAPRPHVGQEAVRRPGRQKRQVQAAAGLDVHPHARVVRAARTSARRHGIQLEYGFKGKSNDELRQDVDGGGRAVHGRGRHRRPRPLRRGGRALGHRLPVPGARSTPRRKTWLLDDGPISWDEVMVRWKGRGPMNETTSDGCRRATGADGGGGDLDARRAVAEPGAAASRQAVEARLWLALRDVEDPEIPISVVGMGLIVSIAYRPDERAVDLELTFTAMGCPAMDFIQDDIRERLLREPEVDEVRIEVVWDPVWTRSRIREDARATMRGLGIVA